MKENDVVVFFDEIENLGILAGALVSIESVNLGKTVDKDDLVEELILTLKAEGSISELYHLLSLFEQFPKALLVESSRFVQHPSEFHWQGTFKLVLMRLKEVSIQ